MRQRAGRIWCARVRGHGQRGPSPGLGITPRRTVTKTARPVRRRSAAGWNIAGRGDPGEPALLGAAASRLVPRETLTASQARQSRERAGRAAGGPGWRHRPAAPWRQRPGDAGGDQHGAHARQGTGRDHRRRGVRCSRSPLRRGWRGRPAALSGPPGTRPAAAAPSAAPPCGGPTELWLTPLRNILPPRRSGRALPTVYTIELVFKYGRRARRPGTHGRLSRAAWDGDYHAGPRGHLCITPSGHCKPTAAIRWA